MVGGRINRRTYSKGRVCRCRITDYPFGFIGAVKLFPVYKSETAFKVSKKMAEASAKRPEIVGETLNAISKDDPAIMRTVIEVMEIEKLLESGAGVDVMPDNASFIVQLGDHQSAEKAPPELQRRS